MHAIVLLVFLAPETNDAALREEIQALQGTWQVTTLESSGKKLAAQDIPVKEVVFASEKAKDEFKKKEGAEVLTYRLNAGKSPKVIEATADDGKKTFGIYEVAADGTLRLCLLKDGKAPPKEFKTEVGDGAVLIELKKKDKKR